MASNNAQSGGIGILGLLTVAFIVLKLCKVIAWSWWWVLSPIWIPVTIAILCIFVGMGVYLIKRKHL